MASLTKIGIVEDNKDPERKGRCRVRINELHSKDIKTENLPWSSPWKDLNGNQFILPDVGKVVLVIIDGNNSNANPEYIASESYNINLENKLKQLSELDYVSMRTLLFDEKTQIYSNDSEGLKIDYKFNNINITKDSINLNLKDNLSNIYIGTNKKDQRVILGDSFTAWFTKFLNIISAGGFMGNLQTPVIGSPTLISHIQEYLATLDARLLSKHVFVVDNESVKLQERTPDVTIPQKGDNWKSTVIENTVTKVDEKSVDFKPIEGPSSQTITPPKAEQVTEIPKSQSIPSKIEEHPDVEVLLEIIKMKSYKLYDKPFQLNIIAVRNQCLNVGDKFSNGLNDYLYVLYKDEKDVWKTEKFRMTTANGTEFTLTKEWLDTLKLDNNSLKYWTKKIEKGEDKISVKEFKKGAKTEPVVEEEKKIEDKSWLKKLFNKEQAKTEQTNNEQTNNEQTNNSNLSKFIDLQKITNITSEQLREISKDLNNEDFEKFSVRGIRYFYDNENERYCFCSGIADTVIDAIDITSNIKNSLIGKDEYYVENIIYTKKNESGKHIAVSISLIYSQTAVTVPEEIYGKVKWSNLSDDDYIAFAGQKTPDDNTKVYLSNYNKIFNTHSEGKTDLINYLRARGVESSDDTKGVLIYKVLSSKLRVRWASFDEETNKKANLPNPINDISGGGGNSDSLV